MYLSKMEPLDCDGNHHSIHLNAIANDTTLEESHEVATADGNASEHSQPREYPSGIKLTLILVNIAAVLILACIDMNIIATALPSITDHFHTVADVGWYSSAFRLCVCAFQFVFGKAYALFSVKYVFLLANAISIAGSLLCGTAPTSSMLVIGRAVAGLGSAGLFSGCFVILVQSVPLRRRPMFMGIMGGVEGVATLAAPLIGGALTQSVGWRWCFYLNAPMGLLTILLTMFCFTDESKPENIAHLTLRQKAARLDLVSNLLFIPALTSLVLAFSWAGTKYPWNSPNVIGPLITFVILLSAFIFNQIRLGHVATLPPRIVRQRTVIAGFIFIMCVNGAGSVLDYYLPTYYQVVRGFSPAKSGYLMLPVIIGGAIGSLIHGAGTSAFGYYAPFMLLASILMPIAAGLMTTLGTSTGIVRLILYTALSGLAYGVGFSGPQNAVQTVLSAEDVSIGLSIMLFAQSLGPAVSISIAQVLFTNRLSINLQNKIPGFNHTSIDNQGLVEMVSSLPADQLQRALHGVDKSLVQTWYLAISLACATLVGSLFIEWRSVKPKRD